MHMGSEHMEDRINDGPKVTKLKPTWTRLTRMTDGQKPSILIEPTTILGKCGVQQLEDNGGADSKGQTSKREKVQDDVHNCKAAKMYEHPYRAQ